MSSPLARKVIGGRESVSGHTNSYSHGTLESNWFEERYAFENEGDEEVHRGGRGGGQGLTMEG